MCAGASSGAYDGVVRRACGERRQQPVRADAPTTRATGPNRGSARAARAAASGLVPGGGQVAETAARGRDPAVAASLPAVVRSRSAAVRAGERVPADRSRYKNGESVPARLVVVPVRRVACRRAGVGRAGRCAPAARARPLAAAARGPVPPAPSPRPCRRSADRPDPPLLAAAQDRRAPPTHVRSAGPHGTVHSAAAPGRERAEGTSADGHGVTHTTACSPSASAAAQGRTERRHRHVVLPARAPP